MKTLAPKKNPPAKPKISPVAPETVSKDDRKQSLESALILLAQVLENADRDELNNLLDNWDLIRKNLSSRLTGSEEAFFRALTAHLPEFAHPDSLQIIAVEQRRVAGNLGYLCDMSEKNSFGRQLYNRYFIHSSSSTYGHLTRRNDLTLHPSQEFRIPQLNAALRRYQEQKNNEKKDAET